MGFKKIFLALSGLFILISALTLITIRRLPDLSGIDSILGSLPKEFQNPPLRGIQPSQMGQGEFMSADGKFKINYPTGWLAVSEKEALSSFVPGEWTEKYDLRALFLAQGFLEGKSAQLIAYKGNFEMPVEEIFNKMKENSENQGWQVETIKSNIEDGQGVFDSKYKLTAGANFYAKEKIMLDSHDAYIISFIALEEDWPGFSNEAESTIASVRLLGEPIQ